MNSSDDGWKEVTSLLLILTDETEELLLWRGEKLGRGLGEEKDISQPPTRAVINMRSYSKR